MEIRVKKSTINGKGVDGVLGIRTLGGRMKGTDESTELWRHPYNTDLKSLQNSLKITKISQILLCDEKLN